MQFSYRGKDDRGGVQQGLLGAPNADAAATAENRIVVGFFSGKKMNNKKGDRSSLCKK